MLRPWDDGSNSVANAQKRARVAFDGAIQTANEPFQPRRDIQAALLSPFQHLVIGVSLQTDLCRHAVKTLRTAFRSRQGHIGNRPGHPAVAVLEGMDRHKPKMGQARRHDWINRRGRVEPLQEDSHLTWNPLGRRCLVMHLLPADRPGHHLHGIGLNVTPAADRDLGHPAAARGKKGRVPGKEPLLGQGIGIIARSVEHHLHHPLDIPVHRQEVYEAIQRENRKASQLRTADTLRLPNCTPQVSQN